MNMKFILFCVAGIGTLMLLYMWFTMNKTITNSQLIEEQYLYRISSLKTEIDFEKRLIDNLRKDIKINNQNYQQKKVLLESMKRKEIDSEGERNKLEKEIESLKFEHDKMLKTFEEEKSRIKAENNAKLLLDKQEIDKLTNELKKLEKIRNELLAKHKTASNKTLNQLEIDSKSIDENQQGKPPIKKNKGKLKKKEKESNQQIENESNLMKEKSIPKDGLNSNKPKEGLQIENDNFQIANQVKMYGSPNENADSLDKLKQDVKSEVVSQSFSVKKNKEKGNESQLDSPRLDVKNKEDVIQQYNPKILQKPQNQQLNPPKRRKMENKKSVINDDSLFNRQKIDDEGIIQDNRQLKPPKKEEAPKDNAGNQPPFLDNRNMKNKMKNDLQLEPEK